VAEAHGEDEPRKVKGWAWRHVHSYRQAALQVGDCFAEAERATACHSVPQRATASPKQFHPAASFLLPLQRLVALKLRQWSCSLGLPPIQLDDHHTQQHPAYYARSRLQDHICKTSHKAVYNVVYTIVCGIAQSTIPRINRRLLPSSTTRNNAQDYLHHHPRYHKQ